MPVPDDLIFEVSQTIEVHAAIGDAYKALMARLSSESTTPDNKPMPMVLEEWPGGRWFRDLGHGQGHLWGFVQVIKPPTLIEIQGPMFMSYAVAGHVQFKLTQIAGGAELYLHHQAIGNIQEEHRGQMGPGWQHYLQSVKRMAEATTESTA